MNTNTSNLSKLVIVFTAFLLITFLSCSGDPVAPEEEKEKPLATKTIGPDGGEIAVDELTLTVPSGAFNSSAEISIYASTTEKPFKENHVSKSYKIDGIPTDYKTPIKISIKKNNDSLSNQNFLVIGEEFLDSGEFSYNFLESSDSSNFIVGYLQTTDFNQSRSGLKKSVAEGHFIFDISVIQGYATYISAQGHFKIFLPFAKVGMAQIISGYLEDAYQKILDLGFSYDARTNWPLNITFRELKNKKGDFIDALTTTSKRGDNYGYIEFNTNLFNNLAQLRVTVGHEFFHIVQSFYDTRSYLIFGGKGISFPPYHWINEAFGAWIEEKFSNVNGYVPSVRANENMFAPFEGMYYGVHYGGSDPINFGYGMSAVAKYIVGTFGESTIIKIYEDIKTGKKHFIDAFCQVEPEEPVEWWDDFSRRFILSQIYSDVGLGTWKSNSSGEFRVSNENDTLATFTETYEDLSGKIFGLVPVYTGIKANSNAIFTISGSSRSSISIYKYTFGSLGLTHVATDNEKIIINDIKSLTDSSERLLIIVSNNRHSVLSSEKKKITLNINITSNQGGGQSDLDYNLCRIEVYSQGLFENTEWAPGTQMEYDFSVSTDHDFYDFEDTVTTISGSFSGNIFTGIFDNGEGWTQTAAVTLNEEHNAVANFSFEELNIKNYSGGDSEVYERGVTGNNVSVSSNLNSRFEIKGTSACGSISDIFYRRIRNHNNTSDTLKVVDRWCTDEGDSRVIIQFYKK